MVEGMINNGDFLGVFMGYGYVKDYLVNLYGIAYCYGYFTGSGNSRIG